RGAVAQHAFRSAILGNERSVWVYTPPGYTPDGEPCGLLLLFDGAGYKGTVPAPTILDNLLAEGEIPPLVAVLVDNPDPQARSRELPCHPPLVDCLAEELLPWLEQHYHITADPARRIVGGASYGGLAAAFVGFERPDLFGNVLAQSGSFWW